MENILIIVNRNGMGHGEPELPQKLMVSYFNQLLSGNRLPSMIGFYGEGVQLTVSGSPVLEALSALAVKGVKIRSCTTCLNFYGILDRLKVGEAGTMQQIVEAQWNADKVITL
ncbi:MAG: sulfurtransferase-like selenium metabolism protein YedF [Fibrobacterota bacterium]